MNNYYPAASERGSERATEAAVVRHGFLSLINWMRLGLEVGNSFGTCAAAVMQHYNPTQPCLLCSKEVWPARLAQSVEHQTFNADQTLEAT